MNAAKTMARKRGKSEIFVIGGSSLYARAVPIADRLYITEVDAEPEGDAFFPEITESEWIEVSSVSHAADDRNDHAFTLRQLDRRV